MLSCKQQTVVAIMRVVDVLDEPFPLFVIRIDAKGVTMQASDADCLSAAIVTIPKSSFVVYDFERPVYVGTFPLHPLRAALKNAKKLHIDIEEKGIRFTTERGDSLIEPTLDVAEFVNVSTPQWPPIVLPTRELNMISVEYGLGGGVVQCSVPSKGKFKFSSTFDIGYMEHVYQNVHQGHPIRSSKFYARYLRQMMCFDRFTQKAHMWIHEFGVLQVRYAGSGVQVDVLLMPDDGS